MTAPRRLTVQYGGVLGALLVTALLWVSVVQAATGRDPLDPQGQHPGQSVSDAATADPMPLRTPIKATPTPAHTRKPAASRAQRPPLSSLHRARAAALRIEPRIDTIRRCIEHRESRGIPTARRSDSGTASGLHGWIDQTWDRYRGYAHAWQAPAWVQRERFYKGWVYWAERYGTPDMNPWKPDAPGVRACF